MSYKPLRKLFYGDKDVYAETYKTRFESDDTVKLDFYIKGNQAFFVVNTEVLRLAYDISKVDKAVSKLGTQLPGEAKMQYSKKCLIDEIVLTNRIEGVHSSRKEIGEALDILSNQSQEKGKQHRFVGLVNKYLKLLLREEVSLGSCENIRSLYDEMFLYEVIAENPDNKPDGIIFRKDQTSIHSETDKEIHQGLYPEPVIIDAMEKALRFLNDDSIEQLFRICVFHYLLEFIHPFYDGNGRLGRFVLSYCLANTLEQLVAFRISEVIKENKKEYYDAFILCNDAKNLGDVTPFLLMMLNMIYRAEIELEESLARKVFSLNKYETVISENFNIDNSKLRYLYSILIQTALFGENGLTTKELQDECEVTYHVLKKMLEQIHPSLLIVGKKSKSKTYQLNVDTLDAMILEESLDKLNTPT